MSDHDDAEKRAAQEAAIAARNADAFNARGILREFLEVIEKAIPRMRAGTAREEAAYHARCGLLYVAGPHLPTGACHLAWGLAYVDVATNGGSLANALAARWVQVRDSLPAAIREKVPESRWGTGGGKAGKVVRMPRGRS